jgi:hypothetical protein
MVAAPTCRPLSGRTRAASPGPGPAGRRRPALRPGPAKALLGADRPAGGVQGDHPLQLGAGGQGWGHEGHPGDGLVAAEGRHPHRGPAGQLEPDAGHLLAGQPRQQQPGAGPPRQAVPLGDDAAVAVLPDGRVVSGGGEGRMLVWEATTRRQITQLACSAIRLAAAEASRGETSLVVAHAGQGFSVWSTTKPGSTEALAN